MTMHSSLSRLDHFPISRRAVTLLALIALAWSSSAFCSQIHESAGNGDLAKVQALLKDNPALVSSQDNDGQTPLHRAALNGRKVVVELLLANCAEINARNYNGETPLHWAAKELRKDVAELLLQHGGHE